MTKAEHRWLIRSILDSAHLIADVGSSKDKMFQRIEKSGAITCYDSMFGKNYYALTKIGRAALSPGNQPSPDASKGSG